MRVSTILCLGGIALSSVAWCIEPNSFLNRTARNHAELMRQVQSDPVVMDRFMRHYGKSREEVLAFLGSLRDGQVTETGPFVVYNVPGSGEIRMKVMTVERGTRAWVDASGAAMLKGVCGNPMTRGTDIGEVDLAASIQRKLSEAESDLRVVVLPETDIVREEVAQRFALLVPETPIEESPIEIVPPTDPEVVDPPIIIEEEGPIALIQQAIGLVASASVLYSRDFEDAIIYDIPEPEPIPEPMSITALALGLGALALRRRKRKQ